jgi:hypothetical protein
MYKISHTQGLRHFSEIHSMTSWLYRTVFSRNSYDLAKVRLPKTRSQVYMSFYVPLLYTLVQLNKLYIHVTTDTAQKNQESRYARNIAVLNFDLYLA